MVGSIVEAGNDTSVIVCQAHGGVWYMRFQLGVLTGQPGRAPSCRRSLFARELLSCQHNSNRLLAPGTAPTCFCPGRELIPGAQGQPSLHGRGRGRCIHPLVRCMTEICTSFLRLRRLEDTCSRACLYRAFPSREHCKSGVSSPATSERGGAGRTRVGL